MQGRDAVDADERCEAGLKGGGARGEVPAEAHTEEGYAGRVDVGEGGAVLGEDVRDDGRYDALPVVDEALPRLALGSVQEAGLAWAVVDEDVVAALEHVEAEDVQELFHVVVEAAAEDDEGSGAGS